MRGHLRVRPAAEAGLLVGQVIAAAVAYGSATASAQIAAAYPTSGSTYIYRHIWRENRALVGFLAGWGFVVGKTASYALRAWLGAEGQRSRPVTDGEGPSYALNVSYELNR